MSSLKKEVTEPQITKSASPGRERRQESGLVRLLKARARDARIREIERRERDQALEAWSTLFGCSGLAIAALSVVLFVPSFLAVVFGLVVKSEDVLAGGLLGLGVGALLYKVSLPFFGRAEVLDEERKALPETQQQAAGDEEPETRDSPD